jgi:hypothetical protein
MNTQTHEPTQKEIITLIQSAEEEIDRINPQLNGATASLEHIENEIFNEFVNNPYIEIGWLARCEIWSFASRTAHIHARITREEFKQKNAEEEKA